eukprot:TRINITY_DN3058_c0_g2_i1.p1 TRINITY_DN3058_c0_g2~~TRINITY_DN3058_c0_g2_i1.p1  ORF type:complete len:179 (-),score=67.78 TRINITY_DN3058_c0_g2_i1:14-550(-)
MPVLLLISSHLFKQPSAAGKDALTLQAKPAPPKKEEVKEPPKPATATTSTKATLPPPAKLPPAPSAGKSGGAYDFEIDFGKKSSAPTLESKYNYLDDLSGEDFGFPPSKGGAGKNTVKQEEKKPQRVEEELFEEIEEDISAREPPRDRKDPLELSSSQGVDLTVSSKEMEKYDYFENI